MDRFSPEKRKHVHLRSRSRSRSKEHTKKSEEKIHNKSKKEEIVKKETKMLDSKELEKKFKDFEAEIHAIDPSNKSEKNETKQKGERKWQRKSLPVPTQKLRRTMNTTPARSRS